MATFFGEILPEFSRAVGDEDEIEESNIISPSSVLRWCPEARDQIEREGCLECAVLLIAIGPAATGFTHTYILDKREKDCLGVICSGVQDRDVNTLSQKAHTDKTCYIYRLRDRPEVLVVECKMDVSAEQAYSWTEQVLGKKLRLLPSIHCPHTYVAVLCTRQISDYRSDVSPGDLPVPFLRSLKTRNFKGTPVAACLEQPNVVSGLPAQILTYCQSHHIAAVLYTCYTDVSYLDITTIKTFKAILHSTPLKDICKENHVDESQLVELVTQHSQHNTLYI